MDILNIPLKIMQSLSERKRLEELACAIVMKQRHVNSTLYNFKTKTIETFFHVSHTKALKLRKVLLRSELFIYNEKKSALFAKSFKSKDFRVYGKGRKSFWSNSDFCYKFDMEITEDMRLHDVVVILRNLLLKWAVSVKQRESLKLHKFSSKDISEETRAPQPTTLPYFKEAISMSKSSAGRYMRSLVGKGIVNESKDVIEVVSYHYDKSHFYDYVRRKPQTYLFPVHSDEFNDEWLLADRGRRRSISLDDFAKFRNVIYRHPGRVKSVTESQTSTASACGGLPDFFYNNIIKHRIL